MAMLNPAHPGETVRSCIEETGWSVTTAAKRLGLSRNTLHRLLNGKGRIHPRLALALERVGWSEADFWMRRQANYDLAQERRRLSKQPAA